MNNIKRISVDLAKTVFQVCALDHDNQVIFNKKYTRSKLAPFMANLPKVSVFMEACYSAHYWGRTFNEMGHDAALIPAQHVKPFVRGNKNDANDALAIAEAAARPGIRFVPIKTIGQQEIMGLHRMRERWVKNRTALSNQARGILSDFGIIFPAGFKGLRAGINRSLEEEILSLPFRHRLMDLLEEFDEISARIEQVNRQLIEYTNVNTNAEIIHSLPGIGFINASAMAAHIDAGQAFNGPKQLSVWLGLTPSQYASGEKSRSGQITKRGNRYLRKQLIHGARATLRWAKKRDDQLSRWINQLVQRVGVNKAVVAIANKLARLMWILLQRRETFKTRSA